MATVRTVPTPIVVPRWVSVQIASSVAPCGPSGLPLATTGSSGAARMLSMPSGLSSTVSSLDTVHCPEPRRWKLARPATSSTRMASGPMVGIPVNGLTMPPTGIEATTVKSVKFSSSVDDAEPGQDAFRGFRVLLVGRVGRAWSRSGIPAQRPYCRTDHGHLATVYFTAASLDGFIVDDEGSLDWLTSRAIDVDGPFGYKAFETRRRRVGDGVRRPTNGCWPTSPVSGCTASPPGCSPTVRRSSPPGIR